MRAMTTRRWILLGLGLAGTLSMAACTAGTSSSAGHMIPTAVSHTHAASPSASTPAATTGSVPSATAWLAASEIPFNASHTWSLSTGAGGETPIGQPQGNGVYYVSPGTVFQAITSCGDPSLMLSNTLGARQRLFVPTAGVMRDQAGQWISSYPDGAAAQAAWHGLQAAYAACPAQEGNPGITLTETAQSQDGMAWFHSNHGASVSDLAPYTHEYFVLHENEIAYVFVRGGGSALAAASNDAAVLATIEQHLNG